jgi:hypothetical protein
MKAHELIDSPDKWFGAGHEVVPDDTRACAIIAINRAYKCPEPIEANLKRALGIRSIMDWNDANSWETVYNTLRDLDI